jgi:hypothetical protein
VFGSGFETPWTDSEDTDGIGAAVIWVIASDDAPANGQRRGLGLRALGTATGGREEDAEERGDRDQTADPAARASEGGLQTRHPLVIHKGA